MLHNKRFVAIALVASTALSYYLFTSPRLWDSPSTQSSLNQLHDTPSPLKSLPPPVTQSDTAASPASVNSLTPHAPNTIAPKNAVETSMDHDFTVVSAEVLALEQQYREGKLPISESDEVNFSPDAAVTPEIAELERQYREGEIPTHSIDDIDTDPNAPVTPAIAELERQYRAGETPRYLPNEIDFSPDAAVTPEVVALEAQYRQRESEQREE